MVDQPIDRQYSIERIERALDRLAAFLVKLSDAEIATYVPIYMRLENEIEARRIERAAIARIRHRAAKNKEQAKLKKRRQDQKEGEAILLQQLEEKFTRKRRSKA